MGNYLQWEKPLSGTSWTETRVEKSTTLSTGPFSEIAIVAIATSFYFDYNGLSTDYYRIRFFDGTHTVFSGYSSVMQGTTQTDVFSPTINTVYILGTLGATGPDSNGDFSLFGMKINQNVAESLVRQTTIYIQQLVGSGYYSDTANQTVLQAYIADFSALRILGVLNGVGITTHFNYTSGGLNIQKPLVSQMAVLMDFYAKQTSMWKKLILRRGVVATNGFSGIVNPVMNMSIINEQEPAGSKIAIVTFDQPNL